MREYAWILHYISFKLSIIWLTVFCETKRNGILRNGTLRNGILRNGILRNGTLRNGTLRNGLVLPSL